MNSLILVKHSMPEIIETVPAREWTLSEEGRKGARSLAPLLRPYLPRAVISSVEPKARETASILAEMLALDVRLAEGLHEHDRSSVPYHSPEVFQKLMKKFFEQPDVLVLGKETAHQALMRFRESVESIVESYQAKLVIIVSHGTVISLFVSSLTGCSGYALWHDLGLPSFVVLDLESGELLKTVNLP